MNPTVPAAEGRTWVPMVGSFVFHLVLFLLAAWLVNDQNDGTGGDSDRDIGVAIVHRMPDRNQYAQADSSVQPVTDPSQQASASSAAAAAPPPAAMIAAIDLDGILADLNANPTADGSSLGDGLSGDGLAGEVGTAEGTGTDAGGRPASSGDDQSTAMVFGVSGTGSRFVYVFDRSDSMNGYGGKPLRAAKRELIRSIGSLTDRQQFALIFYNDRPTPFGASSGPGSMITAERGMVVSATRYIGGITAYGGTGHLDALEMALSMAPDVIFFLTDAAVPSLSRTQLGDVRARAQSSGTTIHTIEFGSQPSPSPTSFLKRLAAENGGQYRYLDVQDL